MIDLTPNRKALAVTIKTSELGKDLIAASDDGYNVLVGSTAKHPIVFNSYATHPHIYNAQFNSTAAGAYQIIYKTWQGLCKSYGLTGFDKPTQDAMCLYLVKERHALEDIDAGNFEDAVLKCSKEWASLPGSTAGQHLQDMAWLKQIYLSNGGKEA